MGIGVKRRIEARNEEQRLKEKQTRKGGKKLRMHNNKEEGRCLSLASRPLQHG
jgi:starvation-inducible outer membrane lipoprotein